MIEGVLMEVVLLDKSSSAAQALKAELAEYNVRAEEAANPEEVGPPLPYLLAKFVFFPAP